MKALTLEQLVAQWLGRVERVDGCWLWPGATRGGGYGHVRVPTEGDGRRDAQLHRVLYAHLVGPIPEGADLDHLCRVRRCVNPQHLQPVTRSENLRRGVAVGGLRANNVMADNAAKTHCKRGHPFDEANTYRTATGGRRCRTCGREHKREKAGA